MRKIAVLIVIVLTFVLAIYTNNAVGYVYHVEADNSFITYSTGRQIVVCNLLLEPISSLEIPAYCFDFEYMSRKIYSVEGRDLVVRSIPGLEELKRWRGTTAVYSVDVYNNLIYLTLDGVGSLVVLDMTLNEVSRINTVGIGKDIKITGDRIYVASTSGLEIYSLELELVEYIDTWYAEDLEVQADYIYLADSIYVWKIDKAGIEPPIKKEYPAKRIYYYNGYLYVSSYQGTVILEQECLNKVTDLQVGESGDLLIRGDWGYLSNSSNLIIRKLDIDFDGYTDGDGDCDIYDSRINPGAQELCDGVDTNCDGILGYGEIDYDGDGILQCEGDLDDHNHKVIFTPNNLSMYRYTLFSRLPVFYSEFYSSWLKPNFAEYLYGLFLQSHTLRGIYGL